MERDIVASLASWKTSRKRKPLILRGARQVGKTWALKEFGRLNYERVAYFSLEKLNPDTPSEYAQFFEATNDPQRIIDSLSLAGGASTPTARPSPCGCPCATWRTRMGC